MEKLPPRKQTSTPVLPARTLALLVLLCAWTATSRADFSGNDSLATGSNWTFLSKTGSNARILFQNNRAEFLVSGTLPTNAVKYDWNANTGSYVQDWSVQVDVHLNTIPLKSYPDRGTLSLMVMDGTATGSSAFYAKIGRYKTLSNSYISAISSAVEGNSDLGALNDAKDTALKISFDSTRKILTAYRQNGNGWRVIQTASIANDASGWNMDNSSVFYAALAGATTGTNAVNSGDAYFTNFVATTGSVVNVSYTQDFGGVVTLWDISGQNYSEAVLGSGSTAATLGFYYLNEDKSGKLSGYGYLISGTDNGTGIFLDGNGPVNGTVSNSGTLTRVAMTILASGTGRMAVSGTTPHHLNFTETLKFNSEIQTDGSSSRLVVTGGSANTVKTDLTTKKNTSESSKFGTGGSFDLPSDVNGDWTLVLNLAPKGNQYTGTAVVTTLPGGMANFTATGNYSPATSTSNITLKDTGLNLNLVIATSGSTMTVHSLKGKMYGQTLNYQAP
jgi:hypothetical protein